MLFLNILPAAALTAAEAECIMSGRTVGFFGDSISRYCYYGFNYYLELGELPHAEYDSTWGRWDQDYDCCRGQTWTDFSWRSGSDIHQMYLWKNFSYLQDARTEFYFVQDIWYDDVDSGGEPSIETLAATSRNYDYLVWNAGWWNLKPRGQERCGDDWSSVCQADYDAMWVELAAHLNGTAKWTYRGSTCCGEGHDNGTLDDSWVPAIVAQNAQARTNILNAGGTYIDVFDLYGFDDLPNATFDMTHPTLDMCFIINKAILYQMNEDLNLGCVATYSPTYVPTDSSTPAPAPLAASCADDDAWHKTNDPSKDCAWVSSFATKRCAVKGWDGRVAYEACHQACDTCPGDCDDYDSATWTLRSDTSKGCGCGSFLALFILGI